MSQPAALFAWGICLGLIAAGIATAMLAALNRYRARARPDTQQPLVPRRTVVRAQVGWMLGCLGAGFGAAASHSATLDWFFTALVAFYALIMGALAIWFLRKTGPERAETRDAAS